MKRLIPAAGAALCLSLFASAHAEPADQLWNKTIAQVTAAKVFVAQDTELVVDGVKDGKDVKKRIKSHLSGWDKEKPLYTVVEIEPKDDPSKPASKTPADGASFSEMTTEMFKPDAKVTRSDGQVLNGKTWTLFQMKKSDGPMDMTMKLWVDPATGSPHKMENHIHGTFMMDVQMNTSYTPQGGTSVPTRTEMQIEVLIPFKGAKMHLVNSASNWIVHPV
ncbi:MAG: hypothetical protein V4582_11550 [Pseudomonadota bacterium]